jgi:Fis family transcriptional regulator
MKGFTMTTKRIDMKAVQDALKVALSDYLDSLNPPEEPSNVNRQVADAIEPIMLEAIMSYACRNQSHAAHCMGINRATLRTKLKRHNLI